MCRKGVSQHIGTWHCFETAVDPTVWTRRRPTADTYNAVRCRRARQKSLHSIRSQIAAAATRRAELSAFLMTGVMLSHRTWRTWTLMQPKRGHHLLVSLDCCAAVDAEEMVDCRLMLMSHHPPTTIRYSYLNPAASWNSRLRLSSIALSSSEMVHRNIHTDHI